MRRSLVGRFDLVQTQQKGEFSCVILLAEMAGFLRGKLPSRHLSFIVECVFISVSSSTVGLTAMGPSIDQSVSIYTGIFQPRYFGLLNSSAERRAEGVRCGQAHNNGLLLMSLRSVGGSRLR